MVLTALFRSVRAEVHEPSRDSTSSRSSAWRSSSPSLRCSISISGRTLPDAGLDTAVVVVGSEAGFCTRVGDVGEPFAGRGSGAVVVDEGEG